MRAQRLAAAGLVIALALGMTMTHHLSIANRGPGGRAARDAFVGPTAPRERVRFGLALKMRHQRAFHDLLGRLYDPSSPSYRHFLTAAQVGRRFGLSDARMTHVARWLHRHGLHVDAKYPQRTSVVVSGEAAKVERAFDLRLGDYRAAEGPAYHRPMGAGATIPPALANAVVAVSGLNDRGPGQAAADIPSSDGLRPQDLAKAYDIGPLRQQGYDGSGVAVAVFTLLSFHDQDIAAFDGRYGISGPDPRHVSVGRGSHSYDAEDALDVETVRSVAPGAQILNYEVSPRQAFGEAFGEGIDQIVADGTADIVSVSYGVCDSPKYLSAGERARGEQSLETAAAAGVNVFIATQDAGAYTCQKVNPKDHTLVASWPSDSPYAIAVGGTYLSLRQDGSYLSEAGWQNELSQGGGGGGLSALDPRPPWQVGPGVDSKLYRNPSDLRQVPDVSAAGDPNTGYAIVFGGEEMAVGGTSGSTPFWAGVMADMKQYLADKAAEPTWLLDPVLYRIGSTKQPFPPFHDVVRGGDRYHVAGPGWDYSTGWGTPDVYNLVRDIAALARAKGLNPAE